MSSDGRWPRVARWLAVLLLVGSALAQVSSLASSTPVLPEAALQRLVVAGEVGMIATGVVGAIGVLRRRAWSVGAAAAWGAFTVLTGGLAPYAFGNAPWSATLWAVLICLLFGAVAVWLARVSVRATVRAAAAPR